MEKTWVKRTFKRYEYFEKTKDGKLYTVGYSIRENEKPYGYKGEQLVDTFEAWVRH